MGELKIKSIFIEDPFLAWPSCAGKDPDKCLKYSRETRVQN